MVSKSRHSWHRKPCCITAIRITAGVLTAATCCISVRHRGYASIDLFKIDADTGATTLLVQEKAEPYADYYGHRYWLREQQNEIYGPAMSAAGSTIICTMRRAAKQLAALTSGNWRR
jgi:hypothetical protein